MRSILVIFAILIGASYGQDDLKTIKSSYSELYNVFKNNILPKHSTHHLVFPGRSLSMIMGMADITDDEWFSAVPFSRGSAYSNSPQLFDHMISHFDFYLKKLPAQENKKILIIDYATNGYLLGQFKMMLETYLHHKGLTFEIEVMTLGSHYYELKGVHANYKLNVSTELMNTFYQEKFDKFAPYTKFVFGTDDPNLLVNSYTEQSYARLKEVLRQEMLENSKYCDRFFF